MMKSSIYHAIDRMNELEQNADRYHDKSSDAYDAGNVKKSEWYDRKAEAIQKQIEGFKMCLGILGLNAWKDKDLHWHIPLDDIETIC